MPPFQTIVAAVDFSEISADTIATALELARSEPQRVHLLHVTHDVFHTLGVTEAPGVDWADVQRKSVAEAKYRLRGLAVNQKLDPRRVVLAVEVGAPAAEIARYADEHRADAIVLGSHGHGVVRRFMLGSVTERVLRQATCPVVVVPHRSLRAAPAVTAATTGHAR